MEDDGLTLPPYDWAIEPQGLGPNVMTAHTLFSDSQPQLVARVLNNSCEDKVLPADTFLSMAEPVQCLSDDGHKPASPLAKGDQSQYDTLFLGESASPAPPCSPSSQTPASETVLCASSVSTATDEATASSSSAPSTEGPQDHLEGLLQRLPDINSLNQKSPSFSMVGVGEAVLPCFARFPHEQTLAYPPTGYRTRNPEFCSCPLLEKVAGNQPPLAAELRLLQLFVCQACSVTDAWACMQLIGRGAILLASSPRALSCAVVSILAKCYCCRSSAMYIVRCADIFDRSLLRIYLFDGELTYVAKMSEIADGDTPPDPMVAESRGSSDDPPGGVLYTWPGDHCPVTGGTSRCPPPRHGCTQHRASQAFRWLPLRPIFPVGPQPVAPAKGGPRPRGYIAPHALWRRGRVVQAPLG